MKSKRYVLRPGLFGGRWIEVMVYWFDELGLYQERVYNVPVTEVYPLLKTLGVSHG